MKTDHRDPMFAGGVLAVLAAVAFGVTTPAIKHFGEHVGPFETVGFLYAGAALVSLMARSKDETRVRGTHLRRLAGVALLGAVVAPVCLAWGLKRVSATTASLLLNFEAVFTVLLARAFFDEPMGKRVAMAVVLMVSGGGLLVTSGHALTGGVVGWGAIAVLGASLGWAADNTLTRPLADLDPSRVVLVKGAMGAALSFPLAALLGEPWPRGEEALALVACGAVGYGMSLRLYLLAQRRIGAGRTGSIFAAGPFVGAITAWTMGDRVDTTVTLIAGALFGAAVYLHLTELHGHAHLHESLEHEHAHRHDDGHHEHEHDGQSSYEHSHWHRHEPHSHSHAHAPDVHHRHRH